MDECRGRIKFLMNVQLFECKSVFLALTVDYHPVCWLDSSNLWPHEFLTSALFWYCLKSMCIAMQTTGSTYGLMITLVEMLNFLRYLLFMFTILVFGNIYEMKEVVVSVHGLQGFAQRHLVMKVEVHFRAVVCLKLRSHTHIRIQCFLFWGSWWLLFSIKQPLFWLCVTLPSHHQRSSVMPEQNKHSDLPLWHRVDASQDSLRLLLGCWLYVHVGPWLSTIGTKLSPQPYSHFLSPRHPLVPLCLPCKHWL